jgi:hypothetical protein
VTRLSSINDKESLLQKAPFGSFTTTLHANFRGFKHFRKKIEQPDIILTNFFQFCTQIQKNKKKLITFQTVPKNGYKE